MEILCAKNSLTTIQQLAEQHLVAISVNCRLKL